MSRQEDRSAQGWLRKFSDQGLIGAVLGVLKGGKEATVYLCRACPSTGREFLAAKVYRTLEFRSFRRDHVYREFRAIRRPGDARAHRKRSRHQSRVLFGNRPGGSGHSSDLSIKSHEFETLRMVHRAGADVPWPLAWEPGAILMELIGDAGEPAPPLYQATLDVDEAGRLFAEAMRNVELFLACNLVHGDLSAFNMLYWQGRLTIIDFPQAVDPRFNGNACALLQRDVENVCRAFARHGVRADAGRLAAEMWARWLRGEQDDRSPVA
jgi:RIO kinase 1